VGTALRAFAHLRAVCNITGRYAPFATPPFAQADAWRRAASVLRQ
jgi:hypothetical protein